MCIQGPCCLLAAISLSGSWLATDLDLPRLPRSPPITRRPVARHSPRAPLPPLCTRYPTLRAKLATAGKRWLRPPASRSRDPTTTCPSPRPSSARPRPPRPRPSSPPAPRSICPSTCPLPPTWPGPTSTTSCTPAPGQRRGGPSRKPRLRAPPSTSCPYTLRTSRTCASCAARSRTRPRGA